MGKDKGKVSTLSATRLHFPAGTGAIPAATVQHLRNYAASTQELGIAAAIAVNCLEAEVKGIMAEAAPGMDFVVLHVPVWGAFVPALNTLLGEAQRRGVRHILYQSLEVRCHPLVLDKLLNHLTRDTLVVGPVLEGHVFQEGEQPLNGRSSPWNTLALWSMRKLALTGFLHIADGMPRPSETFTRQVSGDIGDLLDEDDGLQSPAMGSSAWWNIARQETEPAGAIPAGVEEVTAIALLQHLLGKEQARAVLVDLPAELAGLVSWKTNWGQDERRKQWHEYKMASKVARPAAQIRQLFRGRQGWWWSLLGRPLMSRPAWRRAPSGEDSEAEGPLPHLNFGSVHHYGESIRPPQHVERICLAAFFLFSANFTAELSAAFACLNSNRRTSLPAVAFAGLLLGGVYLPMPASLCLSRMAVSRADHISGMLLFAGALFVAHALVVFCELNTQALCVQQTVLLIARFVSGIGSGVLFQARFILVSLSTEDHFLDLLSRSFLASDLGLGVGALLPWLAAVLAGSAELSERSPDLAASSMLALLSLAFIAWVLACFPRRLHRLPSSVRFPEPDGPLSPMSGGGGGGGKGRPWVLLLSGTARIFVQTAGVITLALCMRDFGFIGFFRQAKAAAALCLLPLPFEALAASGCMQSAGGPERGRRRTRAMAICTVLAVLATAACSFAAGWPTGGGHRTALVALEQALLLMALAFAAPLNVSRLYRAGNLEESLVALEWLKAYVGRLLGPAFAIVVQNWLGYEPLLLVLCCATIVVALTA